MPKSPSKRPEDVRRSSHRWPRHLHLTQEANTKRNTVQGALQWLEDNQDKSIEDIQAEAATKANDDAEDDADTKAQIAELEGGATAKSLVCNECGKKFRNPDLASFHASKTFVLRISSERNPALTGPT